MDLEGCSRCDGPGHAGITFYKLDNPIPLGGVTEATYYAICPTTQAPILLAYHAVDPEPI